VRLDAIDAPERGQAFGKRSQQSLADISAAKAATIVERGKDRYVRTLGRVMCAGVEANSEQVRRGMAWVYVRYTPKGSPLYGLEADARLRRMGLRSEPRPIAPWEWRQRKNAPTPVYGREGSRHWGALARLFALLPTMKAG
jgi:endonuclease YncB( thermonuclease family)